MVYFSTWEIFIEIQLVYLIGIFEDDHKDNVRDRFETDSVNVMKKWLFVAKKPKEISSISTWLSHISKPWKLSLETTTLKTLVGHTGLRQTVEKLDDLEKYWAHATSNL